MTENRKIYAGNALPDLELGADIWRGWSVSTLCRSGVEPPTGMIHPRESIGWMTENRKIRAGNALPDLEFWADIWWGWSVPSFCRSGVEPPTGMIHPRESIGWMTENRKIRAGNALPNLKARQIFGGGGSFRSGVQPPTGSRGGGLTPDRLKIDRLKKLGSTPNQRF